MQSPLKININGSEYALDATMEHFTSVGRTKEIEPLTIPLDRIRSKDGCWYILWDKDLNSYYRLSATTALHSIPLSVEWVKITLQEREDTIRDRVDTLILLYQSISIIRTIPVEEKLRRTDNTLKKAVILFIDQKQA